MTLENLSALSLSQQIIVALIPDEFRVFATDGYSHVGKAETFLGMRALPTKIGRKSIVPQQTLTLYHWL